VDSPPEPLTPNEHRRLVEIIGRDAPDRLPLARDAVNKRWLSDAEAQTLTSVLLDVFLRSLDAHDEPSREGVEADDLLGRIEMQREGYWNR
jgi:hypothetical protein